MREHALARAAAGAFLLIAIMETKHAFHRHPRKRPRRTRSGAGRAKPAHAGDRSADAPVTDRDTVIKWAPLVVPLLAVMLVTTVYLGIGSLLSSA